MGLVDNLFKSRRGKLYSIKTYVADDRKNLGNDYRSNLLVKSVSSFIMRNDTVSKFVEMIQDVFADLIDSVSYLKTYKSFTVKKGYKKVR